MRATAHACTADGDDDLSFVEAAVLGLWWIGREWCFGVREHNGWARCDACVAAGKDRLLFTRRLVEDVYLLSSILYRRVQT